MAKIRGIPELVTKPSFKGQFMVNAWRGQLVARAWPRLRGPPKSEKQRQSIETFTNRVRLAKYTFGIDQWHAKEFTRQSGTYPRDLILKAMSGRLFEVLIIDGKEHVAVAIIQDVSWNLDLLSKDPGSILARGPDMWGEVAPGQDGYVLTSQGPGQAPVFADPAHFQEEDLIAFATVRRSADLTILDGVPTIIPWQTVISDKFAMFDLAAPTRLTVPVGGLRARPFFAAQWNPTLVAASTNFMIWKNGLQTEPVPRYSLANVDIITVGVTGGMFDVQAGDFFEVRLRQDSGASATLFDSSSTFFGLEIYR